MLDRQLLHAERVLAGRVRVFRALFRSVLGENQRNAFEKAAPALETHQTGVIFEKLAGNLSVAGHRFDTKTLAEASKTHLVLRCGGKVGPIRMHHLFIGRGIERQVGLGVSAKGGFGRGLLRVRVCGAVEPVAAEKRALELGLEFEKRLEGHLRFDSFLEPVAAAVAEVEEKNINRKRINDAS